MKTTLKPLAIALLSIHLVACGGGTETPESGLQKSREYLQTNDYASAKVVLITATRDNPQHAPLRYELAKVLYATGNFQSAEKEILKARELGMADNLTQPMLAKVLHKLNRFSDVIALQEENVSDLSQKDNALLLSMIGRSFLAMGNSRAARTNLEYALKEDPESVDALIGMAGISLGTNNTEDALVWAERAKAANPASADAWAALASVYDVLIRREEAIEALNRAIELQPYIDLKLAERALWLTNEKQFEKAWQDINALEKSPYGKLWYTQYIKGKLQFEEGNYEDAVWSFNNSLAENPNHAESQFYAAYVNSKMGNYEQARSLASQAVDSMPGSPGAMGLLAEILANSQEHQKGVEMLEELVSTYPDFVQAMQALGTAYFEDGNYDKAIPVFERVLEIAPEKQETQELLMLARTQSGADMAILEQQSEKLDSPYSREFWLAYASLQRGDYTKAREMALTLRETHPEKTDPLKLIALTYMSERDWANARPIFEELVERAPRDYEALKNLVSFEIAAGNATAARAALEALLRVHGKTPEAALFAYSQFNNLGDRDRADELLEQAFARQPDNLSLSTALIGRDFTRQDYKSVIRLVQDLDPEALKNDPQLLTLGGLALARDDRPGEALPYLKQLSEVQPESKWSQSIYAEALWRAGRLNDAAAAYERAATLDPESYGIQIRQLRLLITKQDYPQARQVLARARENQDADAELLILEGQLDLFEGDPAKAAAKLEQAYDAAPSADAAIWRARALVIQKKFDEAVNALDRRLEAHPHELYVLMEKAGVFLSQQRENEALKVYQQVIEFYPDHIPALNNVAWFARNDDLDYALGIANRAHELAPKDTAVMDTLGSLLLQAGDKEAALALLQQASELAPQNREIKLHLAAALEANGQEEKARRVREGLAQSPAQ